ncbi:MAG: hypothetical protein AAFR21_04280 [Pseudomonadota bacterium]
MRSSEQARSSFGTSLHSEREIQSGLRYLASALAGIFSLVTIASAEFMPAKQLPPEILDQCEANAKPVAFADPQIAEAINRLTRLGVLSSSDLDGIDIGFCSLRDAFGPFATTSCKEDIILLDDIYRQKDQAIVLSATLAHEVLHVAQHRTLKAHHGDQYCSSDQYDLDKVWMEEKADAFGNGAGALLFSGRETSVANMCNDPVRIYLEAEQPVSSSEEPLSFITIQPGKSVSFSEKTTSNRFRLAAQTEPATGETRRWSGTNNRHTRFIEGKLYALKDIELTAAMPTEGPFTLTLCDETTNR